MIALLHGLLASTPAQAACQQPALSVQVEQRKLLEGEVQAGVAMFKGAASGSSEVEAAWQANLPSQSIVDNQWRLYLLCQSFESGMLSRDAYCAASAGIWEQIVGRPIPAEGCEKGTPDQVASLPRVQITPSVAPVDVPPVVNIIPAEEVASRHWVQSPQTNNSVELWGPFTDATGAPLWVAFADSSISYLVGQDGKYQELLLFARLGVVPWSSITIQDAAERLTVTADGTTLEFSVAAGPMSGEPTGTWSAEFFGRVPPLVRPARLEFVGDDVSVAWTKSGCTASWTRVAAEGRIISFVERVDQVLLCANGARVDAEVLSEDTLLLTWQSAGIPVWGIARRDPTR
jgi:hypothetical protein